MVVALGLVLVLGSAGATLASPVETELPTTALAREAEAIARARRAWKGDGGPGAMFQSRDVIAYPEYAPES